MQTSTRNMLLAQVTVTDCTSASMMLKSVSFALLAVKACMQAPHAVSMSVVHSSNTPLLCNRQGPNSTCLSLKSVSKELRKQGNVLHTPLPPPPPTPLFTFAPLTILHHLDSRLYTKSLNFVHACMRGSKYRLLRAHCSGKNTTLPLCTFTYHELDSIPAVLCCLLSCIQQLRLSSLSLLNPLSPLCCLSSTITSSVCTPVLNPVQPASDCYSRSP